MGRNVLITPPGQRFWNLVDVTGSCWLWKGTTNGDGYGRFNIGNHKLMGAHRFAYEYCIGPVGESQVLHRCDNPRCVNPDHLFLGTHSDNMKDMYAKKRHGNGKPTQCHPDRPYHAKGLCQQCYMRRYNGK